MKVKSRAIAIIMTLIIGLSLLFSITGCGDDDDPLGLATLELTSSNSINYARQGSINRFVRSVASQKTTDRTNRFMSGIFHITEASSKKSYMTLSHRTSLIRLEKATS